jgi:hypothetical protein
MTAERGLSGYPARSLREELPAAAGRLSARVSPR